ncbi:paired amphipathic helix protein Sin3-like 4 isoform X1 [Fagus crenata]
MDQTIGFSDLSLQSATEYLRLVKHTFQNNEEIYEDFLKILKDCRANRIGVTHVVSKAKHLFMGHHELLLGFNTFLPEEYKITVPLIQGEPVSKHPNFRTAINFVNRVKQRFVDDEQRYQSFLRYLNEYRAGKKSLKKLVLEMFILFHDNQDLQEEFCFFLPNDPSLTLSIRKVKRKEPEGKSRMSKPKNLFLFLFLRAILVIPVVIVLGVMLGYLI